MTDQISSKDAVLDVEIIDTSIIARIIDDINILSKQLWDIDLFSPRLIPLSQLVLPCTDDPLDFDIHCACLGSIIDSINVNSMKSLLPEEELKRKYTENNCKIIDDEELSNELKRIFSIEEDIKFFEWRPLYSIDYLSILFKIQLDDGDSLITKLRDVRRVRNVVPVVHSVKREQAEKTFQNLDIEFPIEDYQRTWIKILKTFIDILKELRDLLLNKKRGDKK